MPMGTCPACRGAKVDAQGRQCWGCNGHGIVEFTSDEDADVVVRDSRIVDRGTNRPGDPIVPRRPGCAPMIVFSILFAATFVRFVGGQ